MSLSPQGGLSRARERLAKRLILQRLASGIEVHALAEACHLSRSHFSRAFKRSTGAAPQVWIQRQRISRARRLLRGSNLSLSQIALECGFCDQAHFCRSFARAMGITPLGWRAGNESALPPTTVAATRGAPAPLVQVRSQPAPRRVTSGMMKNTTGRMTKKLTIRLPASGPPSTGNAAKNGASRAGTSRVIGQITR